MTDQQQLGYQRKHYRGAGRASWKYYTMRLPHEDYGDLRREAARQGVSVNELIRTYIVWGLDWEKNPPAKPKTRVDWLWEKNPRA